MKAIITCSRCLVPASHHHLVTNTTAAAPPPPPLTCASEDKPPPLSYLVHHTFILTLSAARNGELAWRPKMAVPDNHSPSERIVYFPTTDISTLSRRSLTRSLSRSSITLAASRISLPSPLPLPLSLLNMSHDLVVLLFSFSSLASPPSLLHYLTY